MSVLLQPQGQGFLVHGGVCVPGEGSEQSLESTGLVKALLPGLRVLVLQSHFALILLQPHFNQSALTTPKG